MRSNVNREAALDQIIARIDQADRLSIDLWADVVGAATRRIAAMTGRPGVSQLRKFATDGAWVDAAFALIELELPAWQLRRIVCDDGQWYCALSRAAAAPEWLDQAVESSHSDLALALVKVAIETMREMCGERRPPTVPELGCELRQFVCCDNF